jgi:hypothetical protein
MRRRRRRRPGAHPRRVSRPCTRDRIRYHEWEHFSSICNLRGRHSGLPEVCEAPVASSSSLAPASPARRIKPKPRANPALAHATRATAPTPGTPAQISPPASRLPSPLAPGFRSVKRTFDKLCSSLGELDAAPAQSRGCGCRYGQRHARAVVGDVKGPPPSGPTMTKHEQKKLGLPHPSRAAAVGRGAGARGSAWSSAGKIVIPGSRSHPATRAATAAGGSGTGGRRGRG